MPPLKDGTAGAAGARALRSAHDDVLLAADQSQTVDAATTSGILGAAAHASRAVQGAPRAPRLPPERAQCLPLATGLLGPVSEP